MRVGKSQSESQIRRALCDGQIVPYFQPLVEIGNGNVCGFEVLARWLHPLRGLVNPDEFIKLAEQCGVIHTLTERVLLQAFESVAPWEGIQLAVNVSPLELRDRSLPERIRAVAEQGSFSLHRLTVEITESALVDNLEIAASIACELKDLGIKLALDDFGTGYSSLRNLQALPFDELKVDRSFVGSMVQDRDSRKIVSAVVGLGQSLGLTTVAEGIEDRSQAEMLQWLGCDLGQGWLYGPPVPAPLIASVLDTLMPISGASSAAPSSVVSNSVEVSPGVHKADSQAIYEGAPVGLCFLDRNLRYVTVNDRLVEMHGVPINQRLGRRFGDVFPDLAATCEPFLRRALAGESVNGLELCRPNPKRPGQCSTLSFHYHPAKDEAGEVIGISVVGIDITEHRQIEKQLRQLEERHRRILDSKTILLWTIDKAGIALETDPDCGTIRVMSTEQICNNEWLAAFHVDDVARTVSAILQSLVTGKAIDIEHRIRQCSGEWRWFRSRGQAKRDLAGAVVGWCGISEDIHEYKAFELDLNNARENKKAKVECREQ